MAGEAAGGRPLMPQSSSAVQNYTFAPPTVAPREPQKNYVFVDEHNRHKRLKVMRACEGCRRRKIKCDAATTNTWPCSACLRLRIICVPPSINYDKDFEPRSQVFELQRSQDYEHQPGPDVGEEYARHPSISHQVPDAVEHQLHPQIPPGYAGAMPGYPGAAYIPHATHDAFQQYEPMYAGPPQDASISQRMADFRQGSIYSTQSNAPIATPPDSEGAWRHDMTGASLSEALGELKIEHGGVAPYIANQKKSLAEAPALEEYEINLPQTKSPDATVRIPPEMMPNDQQALRYFDYFFRNIHPYVPVINRSYFYQQWHNNRDSISPLILEAIFACASRMIDDPAQGNKWLALATKHEESFKDVPRLSTIQAILLLLKAREASPKRGYYYRSWMTVVNMVAMAKDLELDDHYYLHQQGKPCGSDVYDCPTKTRVWNTLFVVETMIGGPQGRFDFGVDPDTVDFNIARSIPTFDEAEMQVTRQFTYFMRMIKCVQQSTIMLGKLKKKGRDLGSDPEFVRHNADFHAWLQELPPDLQIQYPEDGSPPWIPSHFLGNMHCYYHLAIIMQHRPQMQFASSSMDGAWRNHMMTCYEAAKHLCRLQEAILASYGLGGLLCMQRGINFTIYSVLTCTMLHLIAITSPDPEFNTDARDYFTRQMRILEQCSNAWPMPEMQAQISALREAFSADVNKPFELKPSFPYGSPGVAAQPSPLSSEGGYRPPEMTVPQDAVSLDQQPAGQVHYATSAHYPLTPPVSATGSEAKADSPAVQSLVMMAAGQRQQAPHQNPMQPGMPAVSLNDATQWNPTKIIDQWHTAFGTSPPSNSTPQSSPPPLRTHSGPGSFDATAYTVEQTPPAQQYAGQQTLSPHINMSVHPSVSPHPGPVPSQVQMVQQQMPQIPQVYTPAPAPSPAQPASQQQQVPYVTPTMWQEAVAQSFGEGLKRRYYSGSMDGGSQAKRAR